jgi:cytoskeleton protein RodZ
MASFPADKPADAADPASPAPRRQHSLGELLRQTRLGYGGDLDKIADELRIRAAFLAAIEEGRHGELPGAVYAQGFVRAYAVYLGLDGDEAVRRFKLETAPFERPRDLSFPMPLTQRSIPGRSMVALAVVLAVLGYGTWYYLSSGYRARPERVADVPTDLLPPPAPAAPEPATPPSPAVSVVAAAPAAAAAPAPPAPIAVTPAPPAPSPPAPTPTQVATAPAAEAPATPAPAPPAPAAAPPPPAPAAAPPPPAPTITAALPPPLPPPLPPVEATGRIFGAENTGSRIVILAKADSWVEVQDADHAVLQTGVMHPGDVSHLPDQPGLVLRTGNAPALDITVDGKPAPKMRKWVRRVKLDPERLLAGNAEGE